MLQQFIEYEQELQRSELRTLRSRDGFAIACDQGELWLTDGDGSDVLLQRGERHWIAPGRLVVMEALSVARVQILPDRRKPSWLSRLSSLFAARQAAPCC